MMGGFRCHLEPVDRRLCVRRWSRAIGDPEHEQEARCTGYTVVEGVLSHFLETIQVDPAWCTYTRIFQLSS